jgi:CheY-like chemotaxis protein
MIHGFVAQSGGAIQISSQVGKGTVVSLWLPRARPDDMPQASSYQATQYAKIINRRLRILLVEDDSLVRMNTAYMLMDLGHSALEAPSAAHALHVLESDAQFDVVVTDYAMPGMNGLDLGTKIKLINPKIPIILATGYAEIATDAIIGLPRLGKPYTQQALADALAKALSAGG